MYRRKTFRRYRRPGKYNVRPRYSRTSSRRFVKYRGARARGIKRVVQRQIETKLYTNGVQSTLVQPSQLNAFGAGHGGFSDTLSFLKPMDLIGQNNTRAGRSGDKVTIMSIEWRYVLNYSDYQQEFVRIIAFSAPFGFTPTYGNVFEASDGNVDIRVARTNANIYVLKQYKHIISPLNSATASSSSTTNTPAVFRCGRMQLNFPGGKAYNYSYNNYPNSVLQIGRNRDIFIVAVAYGAERLQGMSLVPYTAIQNQELDIRFKDA